MRNLNEKSEYLLRMMGDIDDNLVEEAAKYRPFIRSKYAFCTIAACFLLMICLTAAVPLLRIWGVIVPPASDAGEKRTLDALMSDVREGGGYTRLDSADELDYVGCSSLAWRYSDSDDIYIVPLSSSELARLNTSVGRGENVGEVSPTLECCVWILDGKGGVTTPYLKSNAGNIGCTVFDYEAEIVPNDEFIQAVSEILAK